MADENGVPLDRPDREPRRSRGAKTLVVVLLLLLLVGIGIGVGLKYLSGRHHKSGAATATKASKQASTGKKRSTQAASTTGSNGEISGFSSTQAMSHVYAMSEQVGERKAGSVHESNAADYIVGKLGEYGYAVQEQPFTTPDGFGSRNVVGTKQGRPGDQQAYTLIIAAHVDSPAGSPGATDDGSGVGVALELARDFSGSTLEPTLQFVFFGANMPDAGSVDDRLFGSRHFVEALGALERKDVVGVIDIDSVGQGQVLAIRTQGTGLQRLKDKLQTFAGENNMAVTVLNSTQDSDNIPFENAQIPAVWVEWCEQGGSLVTDNTYAAVDPAKLEAAGNLVEGFVKGLATNDLEELRY